MYRLITCAGITIQDAGLRLLQLLQLLGNRCICDLILIVNFHVALI